MNVTDLVAFGALFASALNLLEIKKLKAEIAKLSDSAPPGPTRTGSVE